MAEAQDAGGAGVASAGSGSERQRAHQHELVQKLERPVLPEGLAAK